jgi:hypothetical protein
MATTPRTTQELSAYVVLSADGVPMYYTTNKKPLVKQGVDFIRLPHESNYQSDPS